MIQVAYRSRKEYEKMVGLLLESPIIGFNKSKVLTLGNGRIDLKTVDGTVRASMNAIASMSKYRAET